MARLFYIQRPRQFQASVGSSGALQARPVKVDIGLEQVVGVGRSGGSQQLRDGPRDGPNPAFKASRSLGGVGRGLADASRRKAPGS